MLHVVLQCTLQYVHCHFTSFAGVMGSQFGSVTCDAVCSFDSLCILLSLLFLYSVASGYH